MKHSVVALVGAACIGIALCGGGGSKAASKDFGDVAFGTYESGGFRVVFTNDTKAVKTWRNMNGAP